MTETVTLRDGSAVDIRPITPADRDALVTMYDGVSDTSRYSRFLSVHRELRAAELTYLTELDHHDHEALVAFEAGGGPMVGVVRYVRTEEDEAEPAMLITDSWQGRGLVTAMLDRLVTRAWAAGIRYFRAPVQAENVASIRALDALGTPAHHGVGTEVEVEVELRQPVVGVRRERSGGARAPLTAQALLAELAPRRQPEADTPRANTIVVGVPGASGAATVVDAAAELAATLGAKLVLVRAWRSGAEEALTADLTAHGERAAAHGVVVATHLRRTTPAAAVVDACVEERASIAVLGPARRGRGASGGLVGGIADLVLRQAPCNVLLLHPRG